MTKAIVQTIIDKTVDKLSSAARDTVKTKNKRRRPRKKSPKSSPVPRGVPRPMAVFNTEANLGYTFQGGQKATMSPNIQKNVDCDSSSGIRISGSALLDYPACNRYWQSPIVPCQGLFSSLPNNQGTGQIYHLVSWSDLGYYASTLAACHERAAYRYFKVTYIPSNQVGTRNTTLAFALSDPLQAFNDLPAQHAILENDVSALVPSWKTCSLVKTHTGTETISTFQAGDQDDQLRENYQIAIQGVSASFNEGVYGQFVIEYVVDFYITTAAHGTFLSKKETLIEHARRTNAVGRGGSSSSSSSVSSSSTDPGVLSSKNPTGQYVDDTSGLLRYDDDQDEEHKTVAHPRGEDRSVSNVPASSPARSSPAPSHIPVYKGR